MTMQVSAMLSSSLGISPALQDHGKFDYILCHGVFPWVPEAVQTAILECCKSALSPNGIAYVFYNTNPAWKMHGIVRDMMQFHAFRMHGVEDQIAQSRAVVQFVGEHILNQASPRCLYCLTGRSHFQDH